MNASTDCSPGGLDEEPPQIGPAGLISVDVIEDGGDWGAVCDDPAGAVTQAALAAARLPEAGLATANVAIALSSDDQVARLNADFRGKPTPTNVLSFPASPAPVPIMEGANGPGELGQGENPTEGRFIGDIIVAAETLAREAEELQIPARHHLQHLVVHGLLHLSGFDHESDHDAERMESLETRILAHLGVPDPYVDPQQATTAGAMDVR
ncbi:MAG: rRNA maturation RNase YbeY [Alphaproteobacteria bacterium]|nr:rRNA maturation RNase YbeY [Alphaproteobacteria bacterium]